MAFETGFRASLARLWKRLRWVVPILLLGGAAAVSALERWRPERVEPARHRAFGLLSAYLDPIRLAARSANEAALRAANRGAGGKDVAGMERRLMQMEAELQHEREMVRRLERVSGLSQWSKSGELKFILADVVGFRTEDRSAELTINRGRLDGVREGLPVVGQRGLVGVVREAADRSARVQAITDTLSAVGVSDAATRNRGIVRGMGREEEPSFIPETEVQPIIPGSVLITSGLSNSLYPKGLVVGTIRGKTTNKHGLVMGIVEPAENFSQIEEALVIRPAADLETDAGDGKLWGSLSSFSIRMTTSTLEREDAPTTPGLDLRKSFAERAFPAIPAAEPTTPTLEAKPR